jgi:GDP-4-dehydro-6-deoxy-D-mannose reductase
VKTVFVTGAEGFVGSHLLDHLNERGYEVVGGVRNRARKLQYERRGTRAIVCDVADAINVARVIAGVRPDAIFHLAGIASPAEAARDPLLAYQSLVTSWANILDAVRRIVPRARVVLASAADVYGNLGSDGRELSEDTYPEPATTFGSLKYTAETIAHTFFRDYHLDLAIGRPFGYLGAQLPEGTALGRVARQLAGWSIASQGTEVSLPYLTLSRSMLPITDVVTAYEQIMVEGRPDATYNICSNEPVSYGTVASRLAAEYGLPIQLTEAAPPTDHEEIAVLRGSNAGLRELHWTPASSLDDAICDVAATYRRQGALAAATP